MTKQNIKKQELIKVLNSLSPLFEDSSNYLGIYEEDVQKLCKIMGWDRK